MENFEFCNPTRIIFGKDILDRIGQEVRSFGEKCLLVTGRQSAKKTGAYDKIKAKLVAAGIIVRDLTGIKPNPLLSRVYEGINLVKKEKIDFIVSLGGGSVMDTGKAVAAGALLQEDVWNIFEGKIEIQEALPVICVPTLAASGSEMNGFMVITNENTGYKLAAGSPYLFPKISFLDPELTFSVPRDYTAYGGVDAICHLMEPYFNSTSPFTSVQDELAEGLMRIIMKSTLGSLKSPCDYEQRAALMWGATLALNGLTRAGVGDHPFPVHLIEHALSALFDIAHGAGLAALLPGWMRWKATRQDASKICQFGQKCLGIIISRDPMNQVHSTTEAFSSWLRKIDCPVCLEDLDISLEDHKRLAENATLQAKIWGIEDSYSKSVILDVLSFCQ